jgi:hypothetical protein
MGDRLKPTSLLPRGWFSTNFPFMATAQVWELLHAGDWACAHADDEALARVATELSARVQGELQRTALSIAAWAERDMTEASLRWGDLADELRARTEARLA